MRTAAWCIAVIAVLAGCVSGAPREADGATLTPEMPELTPDVRRDLTAPGVRAFNLTVAGEPAPGFVGVPNGTATQLLVICKGYTNLGETWVEALKAYADRGILAVVMEYRGEDDDFKVKAGAEDTVAATLALQALHPSIEQTVIYGFSMGGEISGLAIAAAPPGTYDHWVNGVGVTDLNALWAEHPVIRGIIEEETGGTPLDVPDEYTARSPLAQIEAIAAADLARVHMAYGAGDAIVPLDHAERFYEALVEAGVPVTYYVLTTMRNTAVCEPVLFFCPGAAPVGPAGHDAGFSAFANELVEARLAREPDPASPAIRIVREDVTGTDAPVPVGWNADESA